MNQRSDFQPKIIAFACHWCGIGRNEINPVEEFPKFKLIKLLCTGRISSALLLKTFEKGADGVVVFGCPEGKCHYNFGNKNAIKECKLSQSMLDLLGMNGKRLRSEFDFFDQDGGLDEIMDEFVQNVKELGPNPLRID
ncbi:MAG: hypothetical protein AMJ90_03745 [candidate division Zixibacteria bacterium SM23_73_2]|nr:MAG: hypothetical protein AMJ90_03745 [candidate division Zixibacteria bacterium SM23_73_2]